MRIRDWSSDVCSSDLRDLRFLRTQRGHLEGGRMVAQQVVPGRGVVEQQHGADTRHRDVPQRPGAGGLAGEGEALGLAQQRRAHHAVLAVAGEEEGARQAGRLAARPVLRQRLVGFGALDTGRSEEHTSELQSLMRLSYAVLCLTKNKDTRLASLPKT